MRVHSNNNSGISRSESTGQLASARTSPVRRTPVKSQFSSRFDSLQGVDSSSRTVAKALQVDAQFTTPVQSRPPVTQIGSDPLLAYELIQGNLVRFSSPESTASRPPPTIVLVHGIMGSRRNMQSFAKTLVKGFPQWQVLLVDLRCHGDSAELSRHLTNQEHSVESAAHDVLKLLQSLKMFPEVLIGHSFGGKVVMSMAHQFGSGAKRLPKPVCVWVLDALPGEVRSAEMGGQDRPKDLISALRQFPLPIRRKDDLITGLQEGGFSQATAQWAATNLIPLETGMGFTWKIDLEAIQRLYRSYENTNLWPLLENPADGIRISFVRAERSSFRWSGQDQDLIRAHGHQVHLLKNSGHWVHADNPNGLFDIIAPSLGTCVMHR